MKRRDVPNSFRGGVANPPLPWQQDLLDQGFDPRHLVWQERKLVEEKKDNEEYLNDFEAILQDPDIQTLVVEQGEYSDYRQTVYTKKLTPALSIFLEDTTSFDLCDEREKLIHKYFPYVLGEKE